MGEEVCNNYRVLHSAYVGWGGQEGDEPNALLHLKHVWIVGTGAIKLLVGFISCPHSNWALPWGPWDN